MKYLLLFSILVTNSFAYNLKMRAREHYEVHELHTSNSLEVYSGLTNTINIWFEKPYDTYFGLSFSPILAGINATEENALYGDKITQQNIGFEFKKFPKTLFPSNYYYRFGLGYSKLETTSGDIENFYGHYTYLGLGKEIPFKNFGLALEVAYRYSNYNNGLFVKTITPSIGFHFYKNL